MSLPQPSSVKCVVLSHLVVILLKGLSIHRGPAFPDRMSHNSGSF